MREQAPLVALNWGGSYWGGGLSWLAESLVLAASGRYSRRQKARLALQMLGEAALGLAIGYVFVFATSAAAIS